jgi:methylene-fatty-acyl-phospholipid synthase
MSSPTFPAGPSTPEADLAIFAAAAALLSLERVCYVWICQRPDLFRAAAGTFAKAAAADPLPFVSGLFWVFKAIQLGVFAAWCWWFGGPVWLDDPAPGVVALGAAVVLAGQVLNAGVFYRLGATGVFYGSSFGYVVPWRREFPFSFFRHPQYVGVVTSIWGLFFMLRFPHGDWFVLPVLETLYYGIGARLEHARVAG